MENECLPENSKRINFNDFTGYVLAGGKSSRMKTDKAFLQINGETFLNRAVKSLSGVCDNRIVIVLNQTQTHFVKKLPRDIPYTFDVFENRGALGGIHAALQNCQTKYAIILAVDLPIVTEETIAKLAAFMLSSHEFTAAIPRQTDGRFQPLCAIYYADECLPPLEELMNKKNSASVRDFLEIIASRFIDQNKLTPNESNNVFFNVNHLADFDALKNLNK